MLTAQPRAVHFLVRSIGIIPATVLIEERKRYYAENVGLDK